MKRNKNSLEYLTAKQLITLIYKNILNLPIFTLKMSEINKLREALKIILSIKTLDHRNINIRPELEKTFGDLLKLDNKIKEVAHDK